MVLSSRLVRNGTVRVFIVRVFSSLIIILLRLQDHADDNGDKNLVEYGIRANSHIQLMVILYEITEKETIKDLVFDLDWGFPNDQTVDYLDGTCFLYTGNKYWRKYDYQ